LADAIDDISETFLDIAPTKAPLLVSLSLSSPSVVSAKLAAELNYQWYSGSYQSGSTVTALAGSTTLVLNTGGFRAGKKRDYTPTNVLIGGVTASLQIGTGSFVSIGDRAFTSGTGSTYSASIVTLGIYGSIWVSASAKVSGAITQTGSLTYKVSSPIEAGETTPYTLWYAGDTTTFPAATFINVSSASITTMGTKWLSGISYYGAGTIMNVYYSAQGLYAPVYDPTRESAITSTYFSTTNVSYTGIPLTGSILTVTQSRTLTNNLSSTYNNVGTGTVTLYKTTLKTNVTSNFNIGTKAINTYGTRGTALIEYFDDEYRRYNGINSSSWDPTSSLSSSQLQVQNERLIDGRHADYASFGYDNYYYRVFTPTNNNVGGTITVVKTGFAGKTNIVDKWNSTGSLQMVFYLPSESGSATYDLGRAVGDDLGSIYGVRDGGASGNVLTWALPAGKQVTSTDPFVAAVRYISASATDYITQLTMTFNV